MPRRPATAARASLRAGGSAPRAGAAPRPRNRPPTARRRRWRRCAASPPSAAGTTRPESSRSDCAQTARTTHTRRPDRRGWVRKREWTRSARGGNSRKIIGDFAADTVSRRPVRQADAVPCSRQPADLPASPARQRFRRQLLAWYRRPWTRAALAHDRRSVSHPRLGGDAAADAGRPRPAEVSRVAGALSQPRSAGLGAGRGGREDLVSARLQHPPSPSADDRAARRSHITTAGCPTTRRRCARSRASAPTRPGALLSFAFRQRAAILDTNVARVLFRVFIRDGELKSHAMTRQLWEVSRAVLPRARRLRLQPGADGPRRARLHGAQAALPGLPDGSDVSDARPDRRRRGESVSANAKARGRAHDERHRPHRRDGRGHQA